MKDAIKIDLIDSNPHRDLVRNPLSQDQVDSVAESIQRTGFWDNLVIRPVGDRYQLAYGHNRLAALKKLGIKEAGFSVRELTDFDMLNCMIDENETQQSITTAIVFENLTASLRLGEQMLNSCSTVEEFNTLLEKSRCISEYNDSAQSEWLGREFTKAKEQLASGEGLGRGFLEHFLGKRKHMSPNTIQAVIDSYYAESRKAAALKKLKEQEKLAAEKAKEQAKQKAEAERKRIEKEAKAAEAQRIEDERREAQRKAKDEQDAKRKAELEAEAKRKEEEAKAAHAERKRLADEEEAARKASLKAAQESAEATDEAEKAHNKAERMEFAGIERELLERLESPTAMQLAAKVIKDEKIPKQFHAQFIEAIIGNGWSARAGGDAPNSIKIKGPEWWDRVSPDRMKARTKDKEREKQDKWLRFHPFDNIVSAVDKAVGSTSALHTAVQNGGDGFIRYNQEDLLKQYKRLEDYADKLLEVMEAFKAAIDGNGVIDSTANVVNLKLVSNGE